MSEATQTTTKVETNEEKQARLKAALGDLAVLSETPKPPKSLSRKELRDQAHARAVAQAQASGPKPAKTDLVLTAEGAMPVASGGVTAFIDVGMNAPPQQVNTVRVVDELGRPVQNEPTQLFEPGEVMRITSAMIQEHGPKAIKALRAALVVVCDEEALRSQLQREMRIEPAWSTDDLNAMADARRLQMNGRVAVVIPSYNYAQFITQAVDSVLNQTRLVDEVIVVDDASTDDTLARLQPYMEAGKIRLLQHAKNSGTVGASRNTGIASTDAEFVVCLDADDMLKPEYVETCLAAITGRHEVGVVYVGVQSLREADGNVMVHQGWPPEFSWKFMSARKIPANNSIPTASMFRREMWLRAGGYDEGMRSTEDVEFWIRALGTGFEAIKCSDAPLFVYRRHGVSMSSRPQSDVGAWNLNFNGFKPLAAPIDGNPAPILRNYSHPAVSVIIPVGPGHQKYLRTALQSLLAQTAQDWEVILVNDTGGPLSVPGHPYALVTSENGHGVANARNHGVSVAHAPLVFFLDADDYLHPDTLRLACEAYAKAGGGVYVYTGWTTVHEDGTKKPYKAAPYDQTEFLKPDSKGVHGVSVLMSKDNFAEVGGFDPGVPWFEDLEFFARCAAKGLCGVAVQEPLLFYRVHTGERHNIARTELNRAQYSAMIAAKYGAALRGEYMTCGSCAKRPDPLAAANHMAASRGASAFAASIAGPGETMMVYAGRKITAPSGRFRGKYRGWSGMPPIPVANEDVNFMLSTTQWIVAATPAMPTDLAHVPMSA